MSDIENQLRSQLMTTQIERLRQEIRTEQRKFIIQALIAAALLVTAGIAIGRFVFFHL
jgi:hypothetical protein